MFDRLKQNKVFPLDALLDLKNEGIFISYFHH